MTDKASGGGRLSGQVMCLMGALAVGLAVALVAGLIGMSVYESRCTPDEECWALLGGLLVGAIAGSVAAAITAIVLAVRAGVGVAFGVGAAIAFLLAGGGSLGWGLFQGWAPLLYFGAALALIAGFVLSQAAGGWQQPKPVAILLLVAVLGVATFPLVKELNDVRQAQREIESLVERPLQPDLAGSELWAVWSTRSGVDYSLLEPESSDGSREAVVNITLRKLPASSAPCTGFADLAPASTKGCTEIQPGVWRGRDGVKAHFWVRGEGDQWAHVSSSHYVGDASRQNARLEEVARSLKPGSSWTLAAAAAECPFCAPLA